MLVLLTLSTCWIFRRPWFQGNLAVVDAGRVVRSAQPTSQLPDWIREYRIRSILNLRGGSSADWWYEAEVNAARGGGVTFYDFPISATKRPTRRELLVLIDTLRSCTYPLLIHCKSGADRTGLASALYMMVARQSRPSGPRTPSPSNTDTFRCSVRSTSTSRFASMPPGSPTEDSPTLPIVSATGSRMTTSPPTVPKTRRRSSPGPASVIRVDERRLNTHFPHISR